MTTGRRRILSVAHSYCVALNRRLPSEIAKVSGWDVLAVSPAFFQGDLRPVAMEPANGEANDLRGVPAHLTGHIHVMWYGRELGAILREGWDLVHCWEEPYVVAGGQVAWLTPPGTPLVYATFQNIPKRYPPPFRWIERYAMRRADGWIAFGRTIDDLLDTRPEVAGRPRRVIPVGVDVDRFAPDPAARRAVRDELGWNDQTPVVGFVGRFVPEKGLDLLMQVLAELEAHSWRALFVGGGPMEGALRQWASRHGARARVVTGVTHDQVPAYLNAMDLLCMPSQTLPRWREQFGRTIIEAFATGVPVLGSDSGEIPHVIGDAGLVLDESDTTVWRDAIARLLLGDGAARRALGAHGRERAHRLYAWPHVARQHVEFFTQILDGGAGAAS